MRFKKYLAPFLVGIVFLTSLPACTLPDNFSEDSSGISYKAYDNKAYSTEEIISFIKAAMDHNMDGCKIFVPKEELIDANEWLAQISGIEQLQCEYRRIKNGFNMIISFERWDNYAIINAYKNNDTSSLNQRQLELYNKYIEILNEVTSPYNSDYENELAIHDYLVENIEYYDNGDKTFNAYNALITGKGICSGYTECFKTLMDMLGLENTTISGVAGDQQHIWNMVKIDGSWYQVDVTWDDPVGSTSRYVSHAYFNITDDDMAVDHIWKKQYNNHSATEKSYTYVTKAGLKNFSNQSDLNAYLTNVIKNYEPYIELTMTEELDLKTAMSGAGIMLTYSFKATKRANYTLYSITFNY